MRQGARGGQGRRETDLRTRACGGTHHPRHDTHQHSNTAANTTLFTCARRGVKGERGDEAGETLSITLFPTPTPGLSVGSKILSQDDVTHNNTTQRKRCKVQGGPRPKWISSVPPSIHPDSRLLVPPPPSDNPDQPVHGPSSPQALSHLSHPHPSYDIIIITIENPLPRPPRSASSEDQIRMEKRGRGFPMK